MRNINKLVLSFTLILFLMSAILGCSGGGSPTDDNEPKSNIDGPDRVDEGSKAQFTVNSKYRVGYVFKWSCEPADTGRFTSPEGYNTNFIPNEVDADTPIKIRVLISTDPNMSQPRYKMQPTLNIKDVTIIDKTQPTMFEIEGPSEIEAGSTATFSYKAASEGATFKWSSMPENAGTFSDPSLPEVEFILSSNIEGESIIIQLEITSENTDPLVKTLAVTVVKPE